MKLAKALPCEEINLWLKLFPQRKFQKIEEEGIHPKLFYEARYPGTKAR